MSYYFGFLLKSHAFLVSDRQRSEYYPDGSVKTYLASKILKVRGDIYVTSAGNLSFAEECVVKAIPQALKDLPLYVGDFKKNLGDWAEYFQRNWEILQQNIAPIVAVINKNEDPERQDSTSVCLAAVDANNVPFIVDFHAATNFEGKILIGELMAAVLPPCPPGMT
jgi:hypothetical protein